MCVSSSLSLFWTSLPIPCQTEKLPLSTIPELWPLNFPVHPSASAMQCWQEKSGCRGLLSSSLLLSQMSDPPPSLKIPGRLTQSWATCIFMKKETKHSALRPNALSSTFREKHKNPEDFIHYICQFCHKPFESATLLKSHVSEVTLNFLSAWKVFLWAATSEWSGLPDLPFRHRCGHCRHDYNLWPHDYVKQRRHDTEPPPPPHDLDYFELFNCFAQVHQSEKSSHEAEMQQGFNLGVFMCALCSLGWEISEFLSLVSFEVAKQKVFFLHLRDLASIEITRKRPQFCRKTTSKLGLFPWLSLSQKEVGSWDPPPPPSRVYLGFFLPVDPQMDRPWTKIEYLRLQFGKVRYA